MIPLEETAAVLLCAGLSRRFGVGNKLLEPVAGKPLVRHAADTLAALPLARRIAILGPNAEAIAAVLPDGFDTAVNSKPEEGMQSSLRIGIAEARTREPRAILICLADMPFVTPAHLRALAEAAGEATPAATIGKARMPPVLFPRRLFSELATQSARTVLDQAPEVATVPASSGMLADFDTKQDFSLDKYDPSGALA